MATHMAQVQHPKLWQSLTREVPWQPGVRGPAVAPLGCVRQLRAGRGWVSGVVLPLIGKGRGLEWQDAHG